VVAERRETPLEANVVLLSILILHEFFVFLVDGVVGQVHVAVVLVELSRVTFRGKSGQALLVDVDSERLVAGDDHVDSQIKLVAIDQKRVGDVSGNHTSLVDVQLVKVLNDVDAATS